MHFRKQLPRALRAGTLALGSFFLVTACGSDSSDAPKRGRDGQPGGRQPAANRAPSAPAHPIFGEQLVINGEEVSNDRLKRHIALGPLGTQLIEGKVIQAFIDMELERRRSEGEDVSQYAVSEEQIQQALTDAQAEVDKEFEDDDMTLQDLLTREQKRFLEQGVRLSQLFDKLYLPENPAEWPPITMAALENSQMAELIDKVKESYEQRKDLDEAAKKQSKGSVDFLNNMFRQDVIGYLKENSDIKTEEHGIPDDVAMIVDGEEIMVAEVWEQVKDLVTADDVKQAKQWIVNTTLAREALQKAGVFMSPEQYAKKYADEHDPYKDSPFSLERLAIAYRKFPNLDTYKSYYRLLHSYQGMIEDEISDETLNERIDRLDLLISGKIDVDIILVSAYDFEKQEWKEDGWDEARKRAESITRELAQGLDWEAAVEKYSEFYDPPVAKSQMQVYQPKNKGRFKAVTRAQLRDHIQENDFLKFLNSASVSDFIFYQQEMGTTNQPLIGPYGFYIPHMHKRILTGRTVTMDKPEHRDLLVQEYVQTRFDRWLLELRQQADLRGMPAYAY